MHMRYAAQRKHIIYSLDTLLYQLHALSFFLSPSLWVYLCRIIAQFQFQRPRKVDPKRSLRFWFFLILFFNAASIWSHAANDPGQGRSIMVDFVGMEQTVHMPSKFHLLSLDILIIVLTMLLTTIAYETSLAAEMPPNTIDPLQPIPNEPASQATSPFTHPKVADNGESSHVLELRLASILDRLRSPVPVISASSRDTSNEYLPLPNTVPWQLSGSLRALMRARARAQERTRREAQEQEREPTGRMGIPGALMTEDT